MSEITRLQWLQDTLQNARKPTKSIIQNKQFKLLRGVVNEADSLHAECEPSRLKRTRLSELMLAWCRRSDPLQNSATSRRCELMDAVCVCVCVSGIINPPLHPQQITSGSVWAGGAGGTGGGVNPGMRRGNAPRRAASANCQRVGDLSVQQ